MPTRGRTEDKTNPPDCQEDTMQEGSKTAVAELTECVKNLIHAQKERDGKAERERAHQETRWQEIQHQLQQLQVRMDGEDDLEEGLEEEPERGTPQTFREPKLQALAPEDDIEHFLTTFERMARACRWPKEDWAIRLIPLLTGKARSAYVSMDYEYTEDYAKVKGAILAKYEITADTYRQRFRALDIQQGETPQELYVRLKENFTKWVKPECCSVTDISEAMILEQFLRMVNPEVEVWIKEHDPGSAEEAARLAEVFISARRGSRHADFGRDHKYQARGKSAGGDGNYGLAQGSSALNSRVNMSGSHSLTRMPDGRHVNPEVRCFYCGEWGHIKPACPARRGQQILLCSVPRPGRSEYATRDPRRLTSVLVNGRRKEALIDTGSTQTVMLANLVPRAEWRDQHRVRVCCIHGDEKVYPTAEVYLTVGGQTFFLPVALAPSLPYPVILGQDIPTLVDLFEQPKICNMVTTRAQRVAEEFKELPFDGVEWAPSPVREAKSRSQRRRDKFLGSQEPVDKQCPDPSSPIDVHIPADIGQWQEKDPTLRSWLGKVSEKDGVKQGQASTLEEAWYSLKGGILYQRKGKIEALVIPEALRHTVMSLGLQFRGQVTWGSTRRWPELGDVLFGQA